MHLRHHIAEIEDRLLREFVLKEAYKPAFRKAALADTDDETIPTWDELMRYTEDTRARLLERLPKLADELAEERDFFGRPSTIGNILAMIIAHEVGHAGQIARVAGLLAEAAGNTNRSTKTVKILDEGLR